MMYYKTIPTEVLAGAKRIPLGRCPLMEITACALLFSEFWDVFFLTRTVESGADVSSERALLHEPRGRGALYLPDMPVRVSTILLQRYC